MVKNQEKTSLYLLAIVAIVAVVGITVLILNQNGAGAASLSVSDLSGQAIKAETPSQGIGKTVSSKVSNHCSCNTYSTYIFCEDGNWDVDYHFFDEGPDGYDDEYEKGVYSNSDWTSDPKWGANSIVAAYCYFNSKELFSKTAKEKSQCDDTDEDYCDTFCASLVTKASARQMENKMNICLSYFVDKCNGEVYVVRDYYSSESTELVQDQQGNWDIPTNVVGSCE